MNGMNVNVWYGIPYAQQPIGNLRWMPPQILSRPNNTNEAYTPLACLRIYTFGFVHTKACLTLNIYVPENSNNLPVFV